MSRVCNFCPRLNLTDADFYSTRNICKKCAIKRNNARAKARIADKLCVACPAPATEGARCSPCAALHRANYHANSAKYSATTKQRRQRLKLAAFNAYGGPRCACCGEHRMAFLSIDHIDGGGAEHRRAMLKERGWNTPSNSMAGSHVYLWLANNNFPPGFQVLCMNCNFARGRFGRCPHEDERAAAANKPARRSNLHLENTANA